MTRVEKSMTIEERTILWPTYQKLCRATLADLSGETLQEIMQVMHAIDDKDYVEAKALMKEQNWSWNGSLDLACQDLEAEMSRRRALKGGSGHEDRDSHGH